MKEIIKNDPTQLNRVKNGYTPLMYACMDKNDPIASYLISIGADVNYKNTKGETAQSICDKLNFVPSIYSMYDKYKHIYSYEEILEYYRLLIIWQDGNLERNIKLRNYLQRMPGVTLTVYRANKRSKEIRNTMYFSTSTDMYETKKFVGDGCCTFIIHLIDAPAYYYGPEYEREYLVLGGGTFWKDAELTITGFNEIESGLFECWYTPPAIQPTDNMSECHITKHQTIRGILLPNTQMGSNPGGIFTSNNACKYYLKYQNNNDRAEQEVLASKLYSLAGIKCANVELAMYNNKLVSLSNWVQSSDSIQSISDMDIQSEIQKGFAIDAWLANWVATSC